MPYKFYGGIHPSYHKGLTSDCSIKKAYIPKKVVVPLLQHTGAPAEPAVKVGDTVTVGSPIAKPAGFVSSAAHASISGKVTRIGYSPTPAFGRALAVTIESQGAEDQEFKALKERRDVSSISKEEMLSMIQAAGVVGLGGAAFPTHVKLSPPKNKTIDSVILNGAECEPYLTCDHRLIVESSKEILKGLDIILKILGVKNAHIAIEDNKQPAIYAMEKALRAFSFQLSAASVKIAVLKTRYPQGAEKQVIKAVLDRIVPAGGLPMDVGCVVQNVGTALAIYEAVCLGKPLIERAMTLTGPCLKEPANMRVRIGTMLKDLMDHAGGFRKNAKKVIVGGPMMGIAQYTMEIPITKRVGGIVFLSDEDMVKDKESVCIRCGKCIEVCPMELAPTTLMYRVKKEMFNEAKELGIPQCFECGACAYECPAKIPLVDYMKYGKSKVLS